MSKLVYVAAPYSAIEDRHQLMRDIARISGEYMIANPGEYAVTGLVNHYAALECEGLGTDYQFWQVFCELMINKSDKILVIKFPGWESSIGVSQEIKFATETGKEISYWEVP